MHWQLIAVAGFVVAVALFLAAFFLYLGLRGQRNSDQTELRLRTDRAVNRPSTRADCRG
jgi:hypothetical protein